MTAPLIGLVGKKRVGKDTFAARLVEAHGFTRVAFADPLRQAALALDPLVLVNGWGRGPVAVRLAELGRVDHGGPLRLSEIVELLGWETAKEHPEVRRTLQRYGVAIRELDPGFWVRMGLEKAQSSLPAVVTDVRFWNEADAITAAGGTLVRIIRETGLPHDPHPSETELDGYHCRELVVNEGTIEALHRIADATAKGHR